MGYRGLVVEQQRARELRADAWTLAEIAAEVGVSRSSVSLWVRGVAFEPRPRSTARRRGPNRLQLAKADEIERLRREGVERIGVLSERDLLIAGTALYAGEGFKGQKLGMANTDPDLLVLFVRWLRCFFDIDETRLRVMLYLHDGLDLDAATAHWSSLLDIPVTQFTKPYRAVSDPSIRRSKHPMGCPRVTYTCSHTQRAVLGLVEALVTSHVHSGVAQLAEHATVNRVVESSSLSPGASR